MAYDVHRMPAEYATAEAHRRARIIMVGLAVYVVLVAGWVFLAIRHALPVWTPFVALSAVLLIRPAADAYVDRQLNWRRGAAAERAVGELLNQLRREGWILMHDVEREHEGNIDHIVRGPGGIFLLETKLRRYEEKDQTKAKRQAAKLRDDLGVFVVPVIVLHSRKSAKCFKHKGVWIVPRQSLLDWLRSQHNDPGDFDAFARFADSV